MEFAILQLSWIGKVPAILRIVDSYESTREFDCHAWTGVRSKEYWDSSPRTGGMSGLAYKLKGLKAILSKWNKEHFGDIFKDVIKNELKAAKAQKLFEDYPTEDNRTASNLASAELIISLNRELGYWKQKANIKWMKDGDCNSKFFHSYVKGKRCKLSIRSIVDSSGKILNTQEDISGEAVKFYKESFSQVSYPETNLISSFIPKVINDHDNLSICYLPTEEEIKKAVWELNPDSAAGPDGFNGHFFRTFWDIIKRDVILACLEFFLGFPVPKSFGSTLITLIPKKEDPKRFGDYRPISLSTFMSHFNTGNLPMVSHLAFADDLVIFVNGASNNLKKLRKILDDYQKASGQEVNLSKSCFYTGKKVHPHKIINMSQSLGMANGSLPFTYLGASIVHTLPQSIIRILHMKMANFLWGFREGKPKYHWGQWKTLCTTYDEGGLGIRSLEDIQEAYSMKLWWKVQTGESKWARYMRERYLRQNIIKERVIDSPIWKRICRVDIKASDHILVKDNQITWRDGGFSLTKAYNICRDANTTQLSYSYCWNNSQIPKVKFFLWRALKNLLPFHNNLRKMGYHLASKCPLCNRKEETTDHILLQCPWSQEIRKFFADSLQGPNPRPMLTLNQHIMEWNLSYRKKNLKGNLRLILPGIIARQIWKEYNRIKYDNGTPNSFKVKKGILETTHSWSWTKRKKKWMIKDPSLDNMGFKLFYLFGKDVRRKNMLLTF
ncbi:unnamed protein product [Cuscuta campestris]|uniref:Reverse transcriptase zinc-binding domain-containing protein n=1 Tax=Cuscuta campestris TaxID=132261 RepID=A0A484L2V5_9ASTE|nr:unnamed protein product [Cuscuta campestris]